jgi:hypothetical protein
MKFISFIIPTIGRETLKRTICSLLKQTVDDWEAIVIFDGIEPTFVFNDDRIIIKKTNKLGKIKKHTKYGNVSSAGFVRNEGFKFVDSKWIGFVDDDDILVSNYVEKLKEEEINENFDLILFRMNANKIIPAIESNEIKPGEVGISFAINTEKLKKLNLRFSNSCSEDYEFFKNAISKGLKYKISKHIVYEVCRDHPEKKYI